MNKSAPYSYYIKYDSVYSVLYTGSHCLPIDMSITKFGLWFIVTCYN